MAYITDFGSHSESGPSLSQADGKKEQTLDFTIYIPAYVDTENLVVKVDGVVLEPDNRFPTNTVVNIINPKDPTLPDTSVDIFELIFFTKADLLKSVQVTIEGLIAL